LAPLARAVMRGALFAVPQLQSSAELGSDEPILVFGAFRFERFWANCLLLAAGLSLAQAVATGMSPVHWLMELRLRHHFPLSSLVHHAGVFIGRQVPYAARRRSSVVVPLVAFLGATAGVLVLWPAWRALVLGDIAPGQRRSVDMGPGSEKNVGASAQADLDTLFNVDADATRWAITGASGALAAVLLQPLLVATGVLPGMVAGILVGASCAAMQWISTGELPSPSETVVITAASAASVPACIALQCIAGWHSDSPAVSRGNSLSSVTLFPVLMCALTLALVLDYTVGRSMAQAGLQAL